VLVEGESSCPEGWEVVLGCCGGEIGGGGGLIAVDDAREEKGGFGVRARIGRASVSTPVAAAAAERAVEAVVEVEDVTAAVRAARATSWRFIPGLKEVEGDGGESFDKAAASTAAAEAKP
jgi:hypothetical protein